MKVLHIGHSKGWRGGENQARLLIEGLNDYYPQSHHFIAYPKNAEIIQRLEKSVEDILQFSSEKIIGIKPLLQLVRFCKVHQIDILHAHSAKAHSLVCIAKRFLPNIKIIVHRRVDIPIKKSHFTRKKYLSHSVDAFIAVSDKTHDVLTAYGINSQRVYLVKDGITKQSYTFVDKKSAKNDIISAFHWDIDLPLIAYVSAFDDKKNPLLFVRMLAELKQQGLMINAVMAGVGKLEQCVQDEINELDLSENVRLLGFIENIKDVFQAIDIFILPSKSEGLGTVLLEAALAECAIVASDVGGVGEVIKNQETGLLTNPDSVNSFVEAIHTIIQNPKKTDAMKRAAKQFVENDFNIRRVVDQTHDIYKRLMDS